MATVANLPQRRKGRKPVAESNARECRDKITAWKLTPEEKRQPPTLRALAGELGIAPQTASYYATQVPDSIEQLVDQAERESLSHYPGILKTLNTLAEKGNIEAIKVFIREVVTPRRAPQLKPSVLETNVHLQAAIKVLVGPANEAVRTITMEAKDIEGSTSPQLTP